MIAAPALLRIDSNHSAAAVAHALVDLFRSVASLASKVSWVQRETECQLAELGEPTEHAERADPALAAAARALAQAIDADAAQHDQQPYHGRQHFCEVMLTASLLCQLHRLPGRSAQLLMLSALIHDLAHDGGPNPKFRLERGSIEHATPYLVAAGVDADTRLHLAALVLATEPYHGVRAARLAQDFHATGAVCAPHADGASELALLAEDAELSRLAMLLCEADVLPSVGLTLAHAMRLQELLASEWGRDLGPNDKLLFVDDVLSAGVIGPFFLPNVSAIRHQLARGIDGPR